MSAAALMGESAALAAGSGGPVADVTLFPAAGGPAQQYSISTAALIANGCPTFAGDPSPSANGIPISVTSSPWTVDTVLSCGAGVSLPPNYWVAVWTGSAWWPSLEYPLAADEFSQGQEPVLYFDGTQAGYYDPPSTASGPAASQTNAPVEGSAELGVPIEVTESEPPLSVTINNLPPSGEQGVGTSLTLLATASPQQGAQASSSSFAYSWANSTGVTFPNGTGGQSVVVNFPSQQETAVINVQVTGAGTGGTATADIGVGGPSSTSSGSPSPSNGATSQPNAPEVGPAQSSGTVAGPTPGKSSGTGTGHQHRRGHDPSSAAAIPKSHTPSAKHGASTNVTSTTTTSTHTITSAATTGTEARLPGSAPHPSGPRPSGSASATPKFAAGATTPVTARSRTRRHRRRASRPTTAHTTPPLVTQRSPRTTPPLVRGRLVGQLSPVSASASPLVYAVASPAAAGAPERRGGSATLLPVIGAAFAVILLFGCGISRELRWRRGRRFILPSSR
ncbi:MAG TPA: hypothetical protein VGG41_00370 [Solirubrobacteraceae bacterium]